MIQRLKKCIFWCRTRLKTQKCKQKDKWVCKLSIQIDGNSFVSYDFVESEKWDLQCRITYSILHRTSSLTCSLQSCGTKCIRSLVAFECNLYDVHVSVSQPFVWVLSANIMENSIYILLRLNLIEVTYNFLGNYLLLFIS